MGSRAYELWFASTEFWFSGLGLPSKAERDGFVAPGAASAVDASRRIIKTCRLRSAPYGIQMGLEML